MLNNANNYINTLVSASADAQSNLYELEFSGIGNLEDVNEFLKVRCNKFTPPEIQQESYDVKFVTATIPRPRAMTKVTRNFTLEFRVDANYTVYKALLAQFNTTFMPTMSFAANDINFFKEAERLFKVKVYVINDALLNNSISTSVSPIFQFDNCWISNITPIAYKTGTADPATVTMTVNFLQMHDYLTDSDFLKEEEKGKAPKKPNNLNTQRAAME